MEDFKIHSKFSHLEKGISPIRICLDVNDEKGNEDEFVKKFKENADTPYKGADLSGKLVSHVMSPVNSRNKYSENYYVCDGVVAVGVDRTTGENISFLTHENPNYTMTDEIESFDKKLTEKLEEIKSLSKNNSIDVVSFGGSKDFNKEDDVQFEESMQKISEVCYKVLGFYPTVAQGPKHKGVGYRNVYFDTENRRLYMYSPVLKSEKQKEDFKLPEMKERMDDIKEELNQ